MYQEFLASVFFFKISMHQCFIYILYLYMYTYIYTSSHSYIYKYIYIYIQKDTHTHTHTHIYIYIYINYYNSWKKGFNKKLVKGIKIFLKKKRSKSEYKWDKNFPDHEKQWLVEYRKKYYEVWKTKTTSEMKSDSWFFF